LLEALFEDTKLRWANAVCEVLQRRYQSLSLDVTLSQFQPIDILTTYLPKIHLNIIIFFICLTAAVV
jgi:hypothetical protein